jgi:hypothetical protein
MFYWSGTCAYALYWAYFLTCCPEHTFLHVVLSILSYMLSWAYFLTCCTEVEPVLSRTPVVLRTRFCMLYRAYLYTYSTENSFLQCSTENTFQFSVVLRTRSCMLCRAYFYTYSTENSFLHILQRTLSSENTFYINTYMNIFLFLFYFIRTYSTENNFFREHFLHKQREHGWNKTHTQVQMRVCVRVHKRMVLPISRPLTAVTVNGL